MAKISSFEDLEAGARTFITPRRSDHHIAGNQDPPPTQAVASGFSQINTKFHRFVNTLIGAPKGTPQLRQKLLSTGSHISQMVKDTSSKLKQASKAASKKIADAKLSKDFESVPKEFQKAERELQYDPFVPQSSYTSSEHDRNSDRNLDQGTALTGSRRQGFLQLNSEIVLNEAIIEEREQGIQEIQNQIGEVNGIFKELAVLVHDQGHSIDDIGSHVDKSYTATQRAKSQLEKAAKIQKSNSSLMCLLLVIFGIVLLIVIIVVTA
ncbi:hypothetical protein C5167_044183 [Papaver somniferum]|uniref:t-SNARE coiled-coil homology domain-containing protein n=1 Tax=Papaver somniferum TaxID=3469 RepID=A0A4Y7LBQ3_PAPSO|nr:syntaxin-22-like [Papaver somniferum]RZC81609.1 hypothetical protein C5167_044183 [Papaver somniferum]